MARKASPEVQYKLMEVAMGRLEPEERVKWVHNFLKQISGSNNGDQILAAMNTLSEEQRIRWIKQYLDNFDEKSLLIGGILDCLDIYIEEKFAKKICVVDNTEMTAKEIMEMAAGFGEAKNIGNAIRLLKEQGFSVFEL